MKKHLLLAVLILAVVTSLTAGTLAAYNQTLSVTGEAHSKKFYFNQTASDTFNTKINIVPGSELVYTIDVGQNMEVPALYTVTPTITGAGDLAARLTKSITLMRSPTGSKESVPFGSFTVDKAPGTEGFTFVIKLKWDNVNEPNINLADINASGKDIGLEVTVNGVNAKAAP